MERHRIHIELELDGTSPTGRATVVGGETRTFTGWVGLMSAVDQLVREKPESEEVRG